MSCVFLVTACIEPTPVEEAPTTTEGFIFLGHPYDWQAEDRVDPRLELLDYSRYAGVWLGGDVCARTSKSAATLAYLDTIFGLQDRQTSWAWGNHDLLEGNEALLLGATAKPAYYTYRYHTLQIVVLNTNLFWYYPWQPAQERCVEKAAQTQWLKEVLDTVKTASHLVLLHHHGLFNEYKVNHQGDTLRPDNLTGMLIRPDCRTAGDFTQEFYPLLQNLQTTGTQVICIAGDVGMRSKGYAFTTSEGIHLLGSGINNSLDMSYPPDYVTNFNPDTVLLVHYERETADLSWGFVRLNDLVKEDLSPERREALPERVKLLMGNY